MTLRRIVLMGNPALRRVADPVENPKRHARSPGSPPTCARRWRRSTPTASPPRRSRSASASSSTACPPTASPPVPSRSRCRGRRWPTRSIEPLSDAKTAIWERCLSLPGLYGYVPRHNEIRLTWHDLDGVRHERIARGFHAMLVQHECDHLDGVLYPMRMADISKLTFATELGDGKPFYSYTAAEFERAGCTRPEGARGSAACDPAAMTRCARNVARAPLAGLRSRA